MKVSTSQVRNKARVDSYGKTVVTMRETSRTTISMAKVFIPGLMVDALKAIGNSIRCTDMVCSCGMMVEDTRVSTMTIRSKAKVFSHGLMVESIMEDGTMASSMELENT